MKVHANAEIYCALNDSIVADGEFTYLKCNGFVAYRAGDEIRPEDEKLVEEAWKRYASEKAARTKRNAEGAILDQGLTPEAVKNEDDSRMAEVIRNTVRETVEAIVPAVIAGTLAALKAEGVFAPAAAPAEKPAPKPKPKPGGSKATRTRKAKPKPEGESGQEAA